MPDAVAQLQPEPLPVIAPAQLIDQLTGDALALGLPLGSDVATRLEPGEHSVAHLRQGEHAMANVRREAGDGAIEVVSGSGVAGRVEG